MEWSRVKNILIVLLVIVNLFLFLVYLGTTVSDAKDNEELISHTVSVLEKNGITIDENIIPKNTPRLFPATGTIKDEVLGVSVASAVFSVEVEGDFETLAKKAGLSHGEVIEGSYATQTVNGIPVYNARLRYDGKTLTGVAINEAETLQGDEPYDICGLLVAAAEWLPKEHITSIGQGFFWSALGTDGIYYLPVWSITGQQGVYYVNAMTGEALNLQK